MSDSDEEFEGLPIQSEVKQARGRKAESAGAKVTVACKLPAGILMRAFKMIPSRELVLGGGVRETKIAEPMGEPIRINGIAVGFGMAPQHQIVGGFALTEGVDKDTWDQWHLDNIDSAMVKNGLIFAYERPGKAADAAKERREIRSNLEPFVASDDPSKSRDPRAPRRASQNLSEVTKADDREAA